MIFRRRLIPIWVFLHTILLANAAAAQSSPRTGRKAPIYRPVCEKNLRAIRQVLRDDPAAVNEVDEHHPLTPLQIAALGGDGG